MATGAFSTGEGAEARRRERVNALAHGQSGGAISRLPIFPRRPPVEEDDDRDEGDDDANHPESSHHRRLLSSMSPNTTSTIHADAPVSINDHENDRSPTNCPRTSAAATRFAKSRTVSLNAARCLGSNRSIVVTQPGKRCEARAALLVGVSAGLWRTHGRFCCARAPAGWQVSTQNVACAAAG
jgi:hypothetical protein